MSLIFDIKRYAINDGPGIRITIFMKGCPMSCPWCHNPEGISPLQQRMYTQKKCIGCCTCVNNCPSHALKLTNSGHIANSSRSCVMCGACANACPTKAMEMCGKKYTVDSLMKEIEKETVVMDQSGGGVTFCGGEPLKHHTFLLKMLIRCGELGIHRAVDTTLFARPEIVDKIMNHVDLFLIDMKMVDCGRHTELCGVQNKHIKANIRKIAAAGIDYSIRVPLIGGVNDDIESLSRSALYMTRLTLPEKKIHLLPYHDIGRGKHEKLGTVYNPKQIPMRILSEEDLQRCRDVYHHYGVDTVIGG